ncbi:MAG: hypothetical protein KDI92_03615 [Xanthomonadales bacterium]|nr:hypothetical protein [Xanthomonadales bacterium]
MKTNSLLVILAACWWAFLNGSAQGAIIVVDVDNDSGALDDDCSLRDALLSASINIAVDGCVAGESEVEDVVIINVSGPIQLNSEIPVFDSVSIATAIGAPMVEILAADDDRIFRVNSTGSTDLSFSVANLKFTGGTAQSNGGGAIYFFRNGGTFNEIVIRDSVFENNHGSSGGAIGLNMTRANQVEIINNQFINNSSENLGGAISSISALKTGLPGAALVMSGNVFKNNVTEGSGGAAWITNGANFTAEISANDFIDNQSLEGGGALSLSGEGMISGTIYRLQRNLFYRNQAATSGGAIELYYGSRVFIEHSMFLQNQASSHGGAIYAFKSNAQVNTYLDINHNTLVLNTADFGANIGITGTELLANNNVIAQPINGQNCSGNFIPIPQLSKYNILGTAGCGFLDQEPLNIHEDPLLTGFTSNPHYYPGFYPTVNSLALDGGSSALQGTDLNGNALPQDGDGNGSSIRDIGALEAPTGNDVIWSDNMGHN